MSEETSIMKCNDQITPDVPSNSFPVEIDGSFSDKMTLQCPFTWKPQTGMLSEMLIKKIENHVQKLGNEQEERTRWTKFILNLVLSYEYCKLGKFDEALFKQRECERIINDLEPSEQSMFAARTAFKHVYLSNKMFLLSEMKKKESSEIMRDITYVKDMDNKERATVWGIGGCVLIEYGPKSSERCIHFLEESLKLDPNCAEWHFLLGKVLGRVRRENGPNIVPGEREMMALHFAVDSSNDPCYKVVLAQCYSEKARSTYLQKIKTGAPYFKFEIENLNEISSQLYRDALKNGGDKEYVLRKCAKGFNKLHGELRDVNLAKECIFKALQLSPGDPLLCHSAALIVREEDSESAKQYFMQAIENGNFSSCYHIFRMKHRESESYDPCADIERYLAVFTEDCNQERLFAWLGAFHHYVKNDFNAALESWLQIFNKNNQSAILREAFIPWNIESWRIDIGKVIIDEIKKITLYSSGDTEEHKNYLEILKNFEKHRPDLKHDMNTYQQNPRSWRQVVPRNAFPRSRYAPESNWRKW